jgi:hypothetical protein
MRTGLGLPSTDAKTPAKGRCFGVVAVLVLGLAVSACVGSGQLANLTETARPSIAFESIGGPPSAVVPRFVAMLKDEASQHQITVGSPGEVNYRLRIPCRPKRRRHGSESGHERFESGFDHELDHVDTGRL